MISFFKFFNCFIEEGANPIELKGPLMNIFLPECFRLGIIQSRRVRIFAYNAKSGFNWKIKPILKQYQQQQKQKFQILLWQL